MRRPNIILTGFMGSGKTTVGNLLAKQLNYDFVDTDHLIEERAGMTVQELFKTKGEKVFRAMETAVAKELGARDGMVVSTGGRLMLDPENAKALGDSGRVFCLVATPEEIYKRVATDVGNKRPLLATANPMERIIDLLQERAAGYGQFSQLVTTAKSADEVSQNLLGIFQANPDLRVPITAKETQYEFFVGDGLLPFVGKLAGIRGPVAIITDSNIGPLYAKSCGEVAAVITIPAGEEFKTLTTVQSVSEQLVEKDIDRDGTIIALGGPVVANIAGFVAATYMRGIDLVHCPTSLLAMADTSIGGKVGINLPQGKNLIGAFKQPKAVIADIATLQSLLPAEFASGMAEIVKHALIGDPTLFVKIEQGDWKKKAGELQTHLPALQDIVAQAIRVKINIVQEDPFDHDRRAVLNLGHTFAHAIETVTGHTLRHGEAVAIGLVAASNLSARLGHCPTELQGRIEAVLTHVGVPVRIPHSIKPEELYKAMLRDKKKKGGVLRFILLKGMGEVFVADDVPQQAVEETIKELRGDDQAP
jgi:shikimate kinase / 3-dehydroquinate synthase